KFQLDRLYSPPPQISLTQSAMLSGSANTTAKVHLESTPPGADISLDGNFVGNTPSDVQVKSGEHTIAVTKSGYKQWERKLTVNGGSNVNLSAELEKTSE